MKRQISVDAESHRNLQIAKAKLNFKSMASLISWLIKNAGLTAIEELQILKEAKTDIPTK